MLRVYKSYIGLSSRRGKAESQYSVLFPVCVEISEYFYGREGGVNDERTATHLRNKITKNETIFSRTGRTMNMQTQKNVP